MKVRKHARKGFTLIELLLVMAILALISIVAITQFTNAESDSRRKVSKFNAKALQNTTENFNSLHGVYPSKWHTGLDTGATRSVEGLGLQTAINLAADATGNVDPSAIVDNYDKGYQVVAPGANLKALTNDQARALRDNGIHQLVCGGYQPATAPDQAVATIDVNNPAAGTTATCWVLTGGKELYRGGTKDASWPANYTLGSEAVEINGRNLSTWNSWGEEAVVLVFCTKKVNWTAVLKGNPDAAGFGEILKHSSLNFPEPPRDPNAKEAAAFPYYIAAFYLSPDQIGSDSGYSCKLLGILDQDLKPVRK